MAWAFDGAPQLCQRIGLCSCPSDGCELFRSSKLSMRKVASQSNEPMMAQKCESRFGPKFSETICRRRSLDRYLVTLREQGNRHRITYRRYIRSLTPHPAAPWRWPLRPRPRRRPRRSRPNVHQYIVRSKFGQDNAASRRWLWTNCRNKHKEV